MNCSNQEINKRKILFSTGSMQAGGTERVISNLVNCLVEEYEITIIIWRSIPVFYPIDNSVKVIDLQKECNSKSLFKNIVKYRKVVKEIKPDIILGFSAPFNMVSIIGTLGINTKMIVCERNDPRFVPFNRVQRIIRNVLYIWPIGVLTQTEHNKDYFPYFIKKKTDVICNPVFISESNVGMACVMEKKKKIVSVARLKKQKNQEMLIKAFKKFSSSHQDYQLHIYGEGDRRECLELLIDKLGLEGKVFLPGVEQNILKCIADADFFVLPSNFEGLPNALLEAMCIGLPCISTKVSGATDYIDHMKNGILIDLNSEEQLLKYMLLLAEDVELKRELSYNASKLYKQVNINSVIKDWKEYLVKQIASN